MGKLGKEKCFDIYKGDEEKRFLLGNEGRKKLFVVGLNPSTANQSKSDRTISRVKTVLKGKEFDGFVMTNLYPSRYKEPKNLPRRPNERLIVENLDRVFDFASEENSPVFWAAWGINITKRSYLADILEKFLRRASEINVQWKHFGPLTKGGHPRHPSRAAYRWNFKDFDAQEYVKKLR